MSIITIIIIIIYHLWRSKTSLQFSINQWINGSLYSLHLVPWQSEYLLWTSILVQPFNYPDHVGLAIGSDYIGKHFVMEVHYDNPDLRNGKVKGLFTWALRENILQCNCAMLDECFLSTPIQANRPSLLYIRVSYRERRH